MKIKRFRAKNFMSFKELEYTLPSSGLYFIGGQIDGGSISNSNRAGKSAFIEALCFAIFGQTLRGIGKDEVVNWGAGKDCMTAVEFEDDLGENYSILRFRNDSENGNNLLFSKDSAGDITGSSAAETQKAIDKAVGLNWLTFSTAVIFGSQAIRFSEAKPSEKAEILDEIMMFHLWLEAQERVKIDLKNIKESIQKFQNDYGAVSAAKNEYEEQLKVINEKIEIAKPEWEKAMENVKELIERMEMAKIKMGKTKEAADKIKAEIEELKADTRKLSEITGDTIRQRDEALKGFADKSSKMHLALHIAEKEYSEINEWLSVADALSLDKRCSYCGQLITAESVDKCKKHYQERAKELGDEIEKLREIWDRAKKDEAEASKSWDEKIAKAQKTEDEIQEVIETHRLDYEEKMGKIRDITYNIESINKDICFAKTRMKEQRQALEESKRSSEAKIKEYDETLKIIKGKMQGSEEEIKYLEFWIEGFSGRGIKSLLLDEILPQLNNKVAYYATALLDNEIGIEFDTEKLLKSGETRNKFDIKVIQGNRELSYFNFSGGEKQRVDVAILLALQSVIFERSAGSCNLSIWDEVFERLDSVGVERVVSLLTEEAANKAIFVISHQNELRDYFQNFVLIRNKNGISQLIEE